MKETKLKLHPCYCGGEMEIKKVAQNGGMDGTYWDWKLTCNKCGLTKYYAADGFYGRKYKTFEEVVDDWNNKKGGITDVLDKIRERIELEKLGYPPSAGYYKAIIKCLQIIDKYEAESEAKDDM